MDAPGHFDNSNMCDFHFNLLDILLHKFASLKSTKQYWMEPATVNNLRSDYSVPLGWDEPLPDQVRRVVTHGYAAVYVPNYLDLYPKPGVSSVR